MGAIMGEFTVIWKDLTYEVDSEPWIERIKDRFALGCKTASSNEALRGGKKVILDRVCGAIKSRQLTGILGPSGAGKTSLLRCLFRNYGQGTMGHIMVEGGNDDKLKVCFIPQLDYLNDFLTVREDLTYVSKLRATKGLINCSSMNQSKDNLQSESRINLAHSTSIVDHDANCVQVADSLGLTSCLDVMIKNISGGQRKRLSIARELMSEPDVLILDEPTTGLDSVTCSKTMLLLQDLAHNSDHPLAVIVTIHQPPKNVFMLFDKTYFISSLGRVIYDDVPDNVVKTLNDVAKSGLPTANYNPASAMIEIASDLTRKEIIDRLALYQVRRFDDNYTPSRINGLINLTGSKDGKGFDCTIQSVSPRLKVCHTNDSIVSHAQTMQHISILTHRFWLSMIRNPSLTRARIVFYFSVPILLLSLYGTKPGQSNGCPNTNASLDIKGMRSSLAQNLAAKNINEFVLSIQNMSIFFWLLYAIGINIIALSTTHYPLTMQMLKKETINGLYSTKSYFISQTIADLPVEMVYPFLSFILTYALSNQVPSYLNWRMFAVTGCACLCCYTIHSLGLLAGSIFINNTTLAMAAGLLLFAFPVMLSGLIVRLNRMPDWMQLLSNGSMMKHGLSAIAAARYGFNLCDCDESLLQAEDRVIGARQLPDNVKHVIEYMFPKNETDDIDVVDMFDKLGDRFAQAQTSGVDIQTCEDVRPRMLRFLEFGDSNLYLGPLCMITQIIILKLLTYYFVRSVPHRAK